MGIDNSILTHGIYAICTFICCRTSYEKSKNVLRTVCVFLFSTTVYYVVSCSIFPIQLTKADVEMPFYDQFSMMTVSQFKRYFWDYFLYNIAYFASYLSFAFMGCILFCKWRKFVIGVLLLGLVLLVHLTYNVGLNVAVQEVVKVVNAEDFLIIAMGFLVGWCCAKITLTLCPKLSEKISVRKSGV